MNTQLGIRTDLSQTRTSTYLRTYLLLRPRYSSVPTVGVIKPQSLDKGAELGEPWSWPGPFPSYSSRLVARPVRATQPCGSFLGRYLFMYVLLGG